MSITLNKNYSVEDEGEGRPMRSQALLTYLS